MIYLDNSATSNFKPQCVIDAVNKYLKNPGNPGRGVNSASLKAGSMVYDTRVKLAKFFHFDNPSKVVFTSGVTESLNTVIKALISSKDHAITTYLEHNSVLRPLYNTKCEISFTDGTVKQIAAAIKPNTKAVIVNHCSNVTGEIQDIKSIGKFCKDHNLIFIVDAAQSAGIIDIDVKKCNIDILCFTGHKALLGLQGIGGMIINTDIYIEPLKRGGTGIHSFDVDQPTSYPEHLEAGTQNIAGIVSLGASVDFLDNYGLDKIYNTEHNFRKQLVDYLSSKNNVKIYQNLDKSCLGIVSFNYKDIDAAQISDYLSTKYDICIRAGAHCAPKVLEHYNIDSCARISFGINNTQKDLDILINALENKAEL